MFEKWSRVMLFAGRNGKPHVVATDNPSGGWALGSIAAFDTLEEAMADARGLIETPDESSS